MSLKHFTVAVDPPGWALYMILHFFHHVAFGLMIDATREVELMQSFTINNREGQSIVCKNWLGIDSLLCLCRHLGPAMTIGVNSDIAKACGIVSTIITPTVPPHPASSGKRTTITARSGRNTGAQRPRYNCHKSNCLQTWTCDLSDMIEVVWMFWGIWTKRYVGNKINIVCFVLQEALQISERNRLAEQRKFIPVWKLRRDPPKDWHMPLNQEKPQDSWSVTVNMLSLFLGGQNKDKWRLLKILVTSWTSEDLKLFKATCWRDWSSFITVSISIEGAAVWKLGCS